jgi:hypothetical protein
MKRKVLTAANRFIKHLFKFLFLVIILSFGVVFVIKFAGPNILKQYLIYGVGDCKTIPILCMQPEANIFTPQINKEYLDTLIPHTFPKKMYIAVPKGFTLVQELIKKEYYKKRRVSHASNNAVIYLLYQAPDAFIKLYPDVQKQGINDNHEFIRRLMYANFGNLDNITDAFFIIMKSIFTPDIGNQNIAKMIKFQLEDKSGYINYNMAKPYNYFDCNVLDAKGNFFKVYIKDIGATLDLNNVFAIISTLSPVD